jgi:hypothetical protein
MSLLADKSAFIKKYGDVVTIIRPSGNLSTFAKRVKGRQLLSPFDINFVRFMLFPSDSPVVCGDLIQNMSLNTQLLVAAVEPRTLQGQNSGIYTELYMVNYPNTVIQRLQPGTVDDYGNSTPPTWQTIQTVPMSVEHVNGNTPYKDGLLLQSTVFRLVMQKSVGILLEDRVTLDSKPYRVIDINLTDAVGMQIVQVEVDMR